MHVPAQIEGRQNQTSACSHDSNASADHDTPCRPVDTANNNRGAEELPGPAGKNDMPANHDHLDGEGNGRQRDDVAGGK